MTGPGDCVYLGELVKIEECNRIRIKPLNISIALKCKNIQWTCWHLARKYAWYVLYTLVCQFVFALQAWLAIRLSNDRFDIRTVLCECLKNSVNLEAVQIIV